MTTHAAALLDRLLRVRALTEALCAPLEVEDMVVQTAPFVSPTRWHLAHTTWFFETFVLLPNVSDYSTPDPRYNYLFNSYYNAVGPQFPQAQRGTQSRPTVTQVLKWRAQVTDALVAHWPRISLNKELLNLIELGINHEQQHQELILMDIKHVLSHSPLDPAYNSSLRLFGEAVDGARGWIELEPGVVEIGYDGSSGFAFDNEGPRHRVYLHGAQVADWLVTNADMLAFMDAGGYTRPELWLSEGWAQARQQGWRAPLYWREVEGGWQVYTLSGWRAVRGDEPVCHVSYFEADALARFMGARLPTEAEWERAAELVGAAPCEAAFLDDGFLHPTPRTGAQDQLLGHVWEWTQSPYVAYPGFVAAAGAVGEYNGKFMSSQMVLRGGSALTPREHLRTTYRNFFGPGARWPMTGLRLARGVEV